MEEFDPIFTLDLTELVASIQAVRNRETRMHICVAATLAETPTEFAEPV